MHNWDLYIFKWLPFDSLPSKTLESIPHPSSHVQEEQFPFTHMWLLPLEKYCWYGWKGYLVVWICISLVAQEGWAPSFLYLFYCRWLFHIVGHSKNLELWRDWQLFPRLQYMHYVTLLNCENIFFLGSIWPPGFWERHESWAVFLQASEYGGHPARFWGDKYE